MRRILAVLLVSLVPGLCAAADAPPPSFEADVLPILGRMCHECHGISKQSGGLRLDDVDRVKKGGRKGAVVVPGKSAQSRLVELILEEGRGRMPPKGDRVPPAEVEVIRRWIDAGALAGPAGRGELEVRLERLPAGYAPVMAVAGDAKGAFLAVGRGSSIEVHRLAQDESSEPGPPAALLDGGPDVVGSLAFSPDGRLLASGGFREVVLWETKGWTEVRRLSPHADRVLALDFSPRGDLLAAAGGLPTQSGEVKLWEPGTGKLRKTIADAHTDAVFAVDFAPDGLSLATAGADRMVHILDLFSGRRLARLEGHTHHVMGVAFSQDGKKLISAGAEGKIKSWSVEKAEAMKDWGGHGKAVVTVSFSPDGKYAASASADRTVRLWNPDGGNTRTLSEAGGPLHALTLFAGGRLLAAAGSDGTVRLYQSADGKLLRSLTPTSLP